MITLQEHRPGGVENGVSPRDFHVPLILKNGVLYNPDLDRFFMDLPLNGVRSPHSLRAYGYDIMVWVRFLDEARGTNIWKAERADVMAFQRARRRQSAEVSVSASSWNRSVAAFEKLYRWAEAEGLMSSSPFTHRDIWMRTHGTGRARAVARNDAYERAAKRSDIRFVSLEEFGVFKNVGLRTLTPSGTPRVGARDRNGTRNALFAELLVSTGLRLEEASFLLESELRGLMALNSKGSRQVRLELSPPLTKGDRGRTVLLPRRILQQISTYLAIERTHAVSKFKARSGWQSMDRPILIRRPAAGAVSFPLLHGGALPLAALTPDERGRLVICDEDGTPAEPAVLWVTETGQPVQPNSWEVIFARASLRCAEAGIPIRINPHRLRHTFAVHMLSMLIRHRLRNAAQELTDPGIEAYRRLLGDPLQQVQRLLGHASLATTYIYLDHIVAQADTVDAAVEEILALVSDVRAS